MRREAILARPKTDPGGRSRCGGTNDSDEASSRIEHLLPGRPESPGTTADDRLFVNAVLRIALTGAPGRDLPERFGNWNSVFQRFNRWAQRGVWGRVMEALGDDADLEWLLIDSTVVRAHQRAAGAETKGGTTGRQAARGGFSTEVHVAVDALGNPVKVLPTAGQAHDLSVAKELIKGHKPEHGIADKG